MAIEERKHLDIEQVNISREEYEAAHAQFKRQYDGARRVEALVQAWLKSTGGRQFVYEEGWPFPSRMMRGCDMDVLLQDASGVLLRVVIESWGVVDEEVPGTQLEAE